MVFLWGRWTVLAQFHSRATKGTTLVTLVTLYLRTVDRYIRPMIVRLTTKKPDNDIYVL